MLTYASGGGAGGAGSGDVTGPASSTDNAVARFDGAGGKTLQNSAVTVSDVAAGSVTVATTAGNALVVEVTEPAATTGASVAGDSLTINAGDAVASTDTAGAAAGGSVTIAGGAAARFTSGNANGGDIIHDPGEPIGTGTLGRTILEDGAGSTAHQLWLSTVAGAPRIRRSGAALRLDLNNDAGTSTADIQGGFFTAQSAATPSSLGGGATIANSKTIAFSDGVDFGRAIAKGTSGATLRITNNSTGIGNLEAGRLVAAEITSPETIAVTDSRKCVTNEGAGGAVTYNLPAAAAGLEYIFVVQATQNMVVTAAAGDTIRVAAGVSSAGGTATNGTIGSTIHLLAINATEWMAVGAPNGTWTLA